MARVVVITGLAVCALLPSVPSPAQVTDARAEDLRASITDVISDALGNGIRPLIVGEAISVVVEGDHYALTIPLSDMVQTNRIFGGLTATMTPTGTDWLMIVPTFGNPVLRAVYADDPFTFTIGSQRGGFTYASAYGAVMAADLALSDITMVASSSERLDLANLTIDAGSAHVDADRYDYRAALAMRGYRLDVPDDVAVRIDDFEVAAEADGFDFAAFAKLPSSAATASPEQGPLMTFVANVWRRAIEGPPLFHGLQMSLAFDGIQASAPGQDYGYRDVSAQARIEGLDVAAGAVGLHISWHDARIPVASPAEAAYVPHDLSIDLALDGVPTTDLLAGLRRLDEAMRTMDFAPALAVAADEVLPTFLRTRGLGLEATISGEAEVGTLQLDASLHIEPTSPNLVAGDATFVIGGIDDAISRLGHGPQDSTAVQLLTMLNTLGTATADATGRPTRTFALVLGAGGEATLNGVDLAPFLKTLGGPAR